jgi:hypothetical protein
MQKRNTDVCRLFLVSNFEKRLPKNYLCGKSNAKMFAIQIFFSGKISQKPKIDFYAKKIICSFATLVYLSFFAFQADTK